MYEVEQYAGAVFVRKVLCILRLDDVLFLFFFGQDMDYYNIFHFPAETI